MVCEGLLNLFGTSFDEINENARKATMEEAMQKAEAYYQPKIDYLQNLLTQHNIPFNFEP